MQRDVAPRGERSPRRGAGGGEPSLAFVVPWRERGRWVWEHLPAERAGAADLLSAAPAGGGRRLPPYVAELAGLARRRADLGAYDVVFAWELRTALAVAVLRRLRPRAERPRFVAVGPILKGPVLGALPLVRWLLADADRIVCFSRAECDSQARRLRLPRERFVFVPTPWTADAPLSEEDGGYILALGHSGRDYPTLLAAARGTDLPVVLVAKNPRDLGGAAVPPNVTVRYRTGHDETETLVAGATLGVVPLHATEYSAGQTVLLRMMARGKAVVVTDTSGMRDYVRPGETAVTVPPGDAAALRAALLRLWDDAAARRRLGLASARAAREEFGFPRFAARMAAIAEELVVVGRESGTNASR